MAAADLFVYWPPIMFRPGSLPFPKSTLKGLDEKRPFM
jgi:hypothetical protein